MSDCRVPMPVYERPQDAKGAVVHVGLSDGSVWERELPPGSEAAYVEIGGVEYRPHVDMDAYLESYAKWVMSWGKAPLDDGKGDVCDEGSDREARQGGSLPERESDV